MKRKLVILAIVLAALYLLFPRSYGIDDGGSILYETPVYSVTKYHVMDWENEGEYLEGWRIEIFGIKVYDSVY